MRGYSEKLYNRSCKVMPGGVSSPIRAFSPYPSFISRGEGGMMCDVDGNEMIDLCLGYGPLILGHGHPAVFEAVMRQANQGMLFGAPSVQELEMAEKLMKRIPCADMVRLANSGTEATMHAIRLARGFTGRNGIVKMSGGFHGAHDALLVRPGSAAMERCIPGSSGVPEDAVRNTLLAEYNDLEGMSELLTKNDDIAAVILEPVMGNCGLILPEEGYLEGLRAITEENGVLLIFDEVITGLRLAPGGAQESFGVIPDICTMGKAIGGGLPAGAVLGKEEIMSLISPAGSVYVAGTFSGNPMTSAAGNAVMNHLDATTYRTLDAKGRKLADAIRDMVSDRGMNACVNQIGSMFQLFIGRDEVTNHAQAQECDAEAFRSLFLGLLDNGVYLPPSQYETNFLCTEHHQNHIDKVVEAFDTTIREVVRSA